MPEVISADPTLKKLPKTKLPLWWVGATASRTTTTASTPIMCQMEEIPLRMAVTLFPNVFRMPWQSKMPARVQVTCQHDTADKFGRCCLAALTTMLLL